MQADLESQFWDYLDQLVSQCRVVIERPRGSLHPRWANLVYPLDYGYLDGTKASDGSAIDVWVGLLTPAEVNAVIVSVDLFKRDAEFSVLLGCTETDQQTILSFSNSGAMRVCLLPRYSNKNELFHKRRSVRRFRSDPVPQPVLGQLLEAATLAPSAHNCQPWRFAVLIAKAAKENLAQAMGADFLRDLTGDGLDLQEAQRQVERSRQRILGAPIVVVLCLDRRAEDSYPDQRRQQASHLMMTQSVAIAGGYFLLAAQAHGLGGVWMSAPLFAQAAVRRALHLPAEWDAQGLILLGYPAAEPERRGRYPLDEVVRYVDE
jgi:F420 biosynthesis protein FbiB-like protein